GGGRKGGGGVGGVKKEQGHHVVGPGGGPEGDREFSFAPKFGRKSVSPANDENYIRRLVAEAAQMLGKGGAVDTLAAFVQRDEPVFLREERGYGGGFLGDSRSRVAGAALRDFVNFRAPENEPAAPIAQTPA